MTKTLEKRIDDALQPDAAITSADMAALMEEAEAGIAKAEKEREVDQTLALDPKAARQAIEDATFAADRLRMLDNERRAAAQRAEGQRHADYLARLNKEARERFDESQRRRWGGSKT